MVRNYVKKTEESMKQAIEAINNGGKCAPVAAHYGIPRTTLRKRFDKMKEDPSHDSWQKGFKRVFTDEQEKYLVSIFMAYEMDLVGFSSSEVKDIAYDLAVRLDLKHRFSIKKESAGKDWLSGFMKRHPTVSLRLPEPTSSARSLGFNKIVVDQFFDKLERILDVFNIQPDNIYNFDETPGSTVPKSRPYILA